MISVIIPSRNEIFLNKTVNDLLEKSESDIEIWVVLEGYWPDDIVTDPRVNYLHFPTPQGLRSAVNAGVEVSRGEYILKIDAHCMVDQGYDRKLLEDIEDNWIVVPRRKRLDAEAWEIQDVGKPDVDYEFISHPSHSGIKGQIWTQRILDRSEHFIDENMTFQGSCYFMSRKHWQDIGGMDPHGYGEFVREAQELSLKTWLGGGKVMTNKNTWYAHLHKGKKYGRGYFLSKTEMEQGNQYCDDYWMNNRWEGRCHDLSWLIERFWPVPNWPEEREKWTL